ncbi:hypothetical protein KAJ61_04345 [Candidatus Parcubacteria bacterium]|nr:hypothetical protein [Candidatus Parcubacteria bacterium]
MSIEEFGGYKPLAQEQITRPGEKLEGFNHQLLNRAKSLLNRFGLSLEGKNNLEAEEETIEKIKGIENGSDSEDDMFLDLEFRRGKENLDLRLIGQINQEHDPNRKIDYDDWDLTAQEEAERWLNREIIIGEKLNKYLSGDQVSADELVETNQNQNAGDLFILKKTAEADKSFEHFGKSEGKALAMTLLNLQDNLKSTEMVKEIMLESNIKTKLELEQKIFEDYFDHFNGYMENSNDILEDLDNENLNEKITAKMETYRDIIESRQLGKDEYSLAHGHCKLEAMVSTKDNKMLLSNWKRPGTTQNRELSLIYDFGDAFNDAVERFEAPAQAEEFISGAESEIREHYDDPKTAEAVINLTKLRAFAMIVNDISGEKQKFVKQELEYLLKR